MKKTINKKTTQTLSLSVLISVMLASPSFANNSLNLSVDFPSDNFSVGENYEEIVKREAQAKAEAKAAEEKRKQEESIIKEKAQLDLTQPNLDVAAYLNQNKHAEFVFSLPLLNGQSLPVKPYYSMLSNYSMQGKIKDYVDFYQYVIKQCETGKMLPELVYQNFQTRMQDHVREFNDYLKQVANGYYDDAALQWLLVGFKAQTNAYQCVYENMANLSNDYNYTQQVKESIGQYKRRDIVYENVFKVIKYFFIDKKRMISQTKP